MAYELLQLPAVQARLREPGGAFAFANGHGGPAWDPRRDLHPGCPVCFGAVAQDVYVYDERALSRTAARLHAA